MSSTNQVATAWYFTKQRQRKSDFPYSRNMDEMIEYDGLLERHTGVSIKFKN